MKRSSCATLLIAAVLASGPTWASTTVYGKSNTRSTASASTSSARTFTSAWRNDTRTVHTSRPAYTVSSPQSASSASGAAGSATTSPTTRYQFTEVTPRSLW